MHPLKTLGLKMHLNHFHAFNGWDYMDWPWVNWDVGLGTPCEHGPHWHGASYKCLSTQIHFTPWLSTWELEVFTGLTTPMPPSPLDIGMRTWGLSARQSGGADDYHMVITDPVRPPPARAAKRTSVPAPGLEASPPSASYFWTIYECKQC